MKRLIALVLVVLMLGSTAAFAADTEFGVSAERGRFNEEATEGSVNTEIWLQVDADGQIDVTVPLVLVFKTNIDGGVATSPSNYALTNRSTADLVVTQIVATPNNAVGNDTHPMELVGYGEALAEDQYKVQLSVDDSLLGTDATNDWDLDIGTHSNDQLKGGLFKLPQPVADENGVMATSKSTRVTADMATGKLSFVTSRNASDGNDDGMNNENGVRLLTIAYTVAIDTSSAIGEEIVHAEDGEIDVENITWATGTDNA